MADERTDPLADLFTLFATPLTGTMRSLEQFRKGVDEFLAGVENFNRTMANLNETSERINRLLADVEGPIRAAVPQVTRTVKAADEMMQAVSGPAMAVAPGLNKLAETLSTPAFAALPHQIGQFSELLGEVSTRLSPLTQLAESAGGLFGGFRLPGTRPAAAPPSSTPPPVRDTNAVDEHDVRRDAEPTLTTTTTTRKPATRKKPAATKKSAAKKSAAKKKPATKKSTAKKRAPARKRAPAKKASGGVSE
jgi:ABC-type transporter Mla subunit MlaD